MTARLAVVVALALPVRDFIFGWRWRRREPSIRVPPMSPQWLETYEHSSAKKGNDR
jgi:hypothetical protein